MKSRKNFAKTISIATTLITLTFFAFGCGDAKRTADTPEKTETEIVAEEETEATEQETETEEPVLFRIRISYEGGVNLGDLPSAKEINELIWVDNGTEFDVYEIRENYDENKTFYRVKMEDGKKMYVWDKVAQIIE